jgi:hypothetical protein
MKSNDSQKNASAPPQESPSGQIAKENDPIKRVSGDDYYCWTFCTEHGRIKDRQRSPKFFRTYHEARAAALMDPGFNAPRYSHRKFYIAQLKFAVVHETIQEVKKPPKRRYIM